MGSCSISFRGYTSKESNFNVLLYALILMRCPTNLIMVNLIAKYLYPFNKRFRRTLEKSYSLFRKIDKGYVEKGHPFGEIKKQLSYGIVSAKPYPVSLPFSCR